MDTDQSYHTQSPTEISMTNTVIPDGLPSVVYAEPESAVEQLLPKRAREKAFENITTSHIPPTHERRTLVLCFDGTGDQFDGDNSNVVQLCSMLKKDDSSKQMVYYQSGIGTISTYQFLTPMAKATSKTLDLMIAHSLDTQVQEGYTFLMQSYVRGDRICIFGFSRGAYTARALAGMLHKIGLLPANNHNQVPFAYSLYTNVTEEGWNQSNAFKRSFGIDVEIDFLGVWDTVNSVGIIPRRLPFTTSNTLVKTFRHALALDERRAKFQPNVWNRPTMSELRLGTNSASPVPKTPPPTRKATPSQTLKSRISRLGMSGVVEAAAANGNNADVGSSKWFSVPGRRGTKGRWDTDEDEGLLTRLEREYSERHTTLTDIKEVWFAGCHSDVGGGSVSNSEEHSLARIPLRWMIRECFLTNTGIMFDVARLREIGLDPGALWPLVLPRPPPLDPASLNLPVDRLAETSLSQRFTSLFSRKRSKYLHQRLDPDNGSVPDHDLEDDLEDDHKHGALGELQEGNEEVEELLDALSPIYDQLKLSKWWWLLEYLPVQFVHQRDDDNWVSRYMCNLGRPRKIVGQKDIGVNVHRSVRLRMEAQFSETTDGTVQQKRYIPKARFKVKPTWVD